MNYNIKLKIKREIKLLKLNLINTIMEEFEYMEWDFYEPFNDLVQEFQTNIINQAYLINGLNNYEKHITNFKKQFFKLLKDCYEVENNLTSELNEWIEDTREVVKNQYF